MPRCPVVLATACCTMAVGSMIGCAPKGEKVAAPAAEAANTPHLITLADFSITAPDTLAAGWTTFQAKNTAQELHHATLIRLDSAHTVDELVAALKNPGPPPAWAIWMGGPQQESEVTIDLTPGNYAWICLIPGSDSIPHFMKGMVKSFVVVPAAMAGASEPTADVDVTSKDYTWVLSTPITAGAHTLKITTEPGQPHEMVILRTTPGTTSKEVLQWMDKMQGPPPVESVQGISTMQAGISEYEQMNFTPGHYVVLCFVPDAKDGKPHAAHGMTLDFDVK